MSYGLDRLLDHAMMHMVGRIDIRPRPLIWGPRFRAGDTVYLSPYWCEVVSFSPMSKIVRFRKLSRTQAPIQRMGRIAFERKARAA